MTVTHQSPMILHLGSIMTEATCLRCGGKGTYWTSEWEYERTVDVEVVCDACHPRNPLELIAALGFVVFLAAIGMAVIVAFKGWPF